MPEITTEALKDSFAVHAENARWLVDRETNAIESLHQRASTLLGFTGVILAILPSVLVPIQTTPGANIRLAAWGIALVGTLAFSLSAAASLGVLLVKSKVDVGIKGIVERWVAVTANGPVTADEGTALAPAQVESDYVNAYFGREATSEKSALLSLRKQHQSKAKWLRRSQWTSVIGILLLGALLATLVGARFGTVAPQKTPPPSVPASHKSQPKAEAAPPAELRLAGVSMSATPLEALLGSGGVASSAPSDSGDA
jgi:hypothetical protein